MRSASGTRRAAEARARPIRQLRSLTVIAQDPSVRVGRRILTAAVDVPDELLEPGPRGARFHVVDYEPPGPGVRRPAVLDRDRDRFARASARELTTSPAFRAQNVYALAARTLAIFERALGRRVGWGFPGHQLHLVPRAFRQANAHYSPDDRAVLFGYVPGARAAVVQTALSHDVVAHETTHAVLDGLRPRFADPGLPDQLAFHEGLADVVALLSVFSLGEVPAKLLGGRGRGARLGRAALEPEKLGRTALFGLAEGMGRGGIRGGALRRSLGLHRSAAWRHDPAFEAPHRRGEVLVAAVMSTLLAIWRRRLEPLLGSHGVDRGRVAEEGATAAEHLLGMVIRAIDYLPPVELELEDVLDAVLTADEVTAPDDGRHGYRPALERAFGAFGITRPRGEQRHIADLRHLAAADALVYERSNHAVLRSDRDEAFRFLWENAGALGIERRWRTAVESLRPSVRLGPDGLLVSEVVLAYTQSAELSVAELAAHGVEPPGGIDGSTPVQAWGGGVLVLDQFGRAKLHVSKPLRDWGRQGRRLDHLVRHGLQDACGRYGFDDPGARGERYAALHVDDATAEEEW